MTFLDAETLVRAAMAEGEPMEWAESISTEVPNPRPEEFITIERTGGETDRWQDRPQVAVQCWSRSRWEAELLCGKVKAWLNDVFRYHPQVTRLRVGSSYNFTDPNSGQARFQVLVFFRTSAY